MGQSVVKEMFDKAVNEDCYIVQIAQMSALAVLFPPKFVDVFNGWAVKQGVNARKVVVDMKAFGCRKEHLENLIGWPKE